MPTATNMPLEYSEVYIENVLSKGIVIVDPQKDWTYTGNPDDNPKSYQVGFADIASFSIGMDTKYLYIKAQFNGKLPKTVDEFPTIDGDKINSCAYNFVIDLDNNPSSGSIGDDGAEIAIGYGIHAENGKYSTYSQYFTEPTGIERPEEQRFKNKVFNVKPQFGGGGTDYHIIVIPLNALNIKISQIVTVNGWAESQSVKYHHSSFDRLCPASQRPNAQGKCGIKVKIGESITVK